MTWCRTLWLCLLLIAVADLCSGLMLERLPRHIPRSKQQPLAQDSAEDEGPLESLDTSVEKKRIVQDPSQMAPFIMKPTWKAIYPFAQDKHSVRSHRKRAASDEPPAIDERDQHELANILRDEDEGEDRKRKKAVSRHTKTKRQSNDDIITGDDKDGEAEEPEQPITPNEKFQEWLRHEYYRNMAKSFATMRRKRDGSGAFPKTVKRAKKSVSQPSTSLSEITDNLRNIEDQLFQDALQVMRDGEGEDYKEDIRKQNRISNDLSLAYDLETMRNAFFQLKDTLADIESESTNDGEEMYYTNRKRSRECPALDQLTSDCSSLSDIMQEGPLKRLLLRACNWHEVCYTCGKAYGLTSEACDGSFIEQTQTICRNEAPCESTASLLVVPLRQRRVFYKRSNPDICVDEPCVEQFLKEGLVAMQEGRYGLKNDAIRHA